MSVLRDVIARFTVEVDSKPLTELDKRINKARDAVNDMGKYAAGALLAAGGAMYYFTEQASKAEESLNVLRQTFKGNADGVIAWSKTLSKEIGRSEYTLQEAAGKFGAFLAPTFEGTGQDITAMSEQLSQLAVDLASFYNTSDEEAQMRLFSGISGETEAVRRLGINISDSALKELHERRGGKGQYKSLSLADKTLLRFEKILQDTIDKQGDAARTAGEWANSMKRVQERWKTFATELGKVSKGVLLPLLHKAETWIPTLENMVKNSALVETAFKTLAIGVASLATAFVVLNPIVSGLAFIAMGLALAFEDFNSFLDGNKSQIGEFIESVSGVNDPLRLFDAYMNDLLGWFDELTGSIMDLISNIGLVWNWVRGRDLDKGLTTENHDAAAKRHNQRDSLAKAKDESRESAKLQAAATGDIDAFAAAFEGTTKPDSMTAAFLPYRKQALQRGLTMANDKDVASGLVAVPEFATMSATERSQLGNVSNMDDRRALLGSGTLPGVNVQVTVGSTSATAEQIAQALDQQLRQTLAAVSEEKGK